TEGVEREHGDRGTVCGGEERLEPLAVAVHRGQQRFAEQRLLSAAGGAMKGGGGIERGARSAVAAECAQDATQVHAPERGEPHVAGRLGLRDTELERRRARGVLPRLTLRAPEARELVGLGLL